MPEGTTAGTQEVERRLEQPLRATQDAVVEGSIPSADTISSPGSEVATAWMHEIGQRRSTTGGTQEVEQCRSNCRVVEGSTPSLGAIAFLTSSTVSQALPPAER
jgi:hypothetical protein